jgi:hypothetical protein
MTIRFNIAKIMAKANALVREQKIRDQQFLSVGQPIPHTPLRNIGYCLKVAWGMAKSDKFDIQDGMTAGGFGLCIVMED